MKRLIEENQMWNFRNTVARTILTETDMTKSTKRTTVSTDRLYTNDGAAPRLIVAAETQSAPPVALESYPY